MKVLAFDIGISSIGWAFVQDGELKDTGVRIFTKAENPKTGESLALPRREARGVRRRLNRRKVRLNELKRLICAEFGLNLGDFHAKDGELPLAYRLSKCEIAGYDRYEKRNAIRKGSDTAEQKRLKQELDQLDTNPYKLRAEALERKLTPDKLARVILHIAKHRGYGNKHAKNADKDAKSKQEENGTLAGIEKNSAYKSSYETIGAYLYGEFYRKERIENKKGNGATKEYINVRNRGKGYYERSLKQEWLKEELELIFAKQREFGWEFSKEKIHKSLENENEKLDFVGKILETAFWQRPLKSYADKVGACTFFSGEQRAPKDSPSAVEFVALTRIINTLSNIDNNIAKGKFKTQTGELYLTAQNVAKVLNAVLDKGELTYKGLRKLLDLPEFIAFPKDSKLDYTDKDAESAKFIEFKVAKKSNKYKEFVNAFGKDFKNFKRSELDAIANDMALIKDKEKLKNTLKKYPKLNNAQIEKLSKIDFSKFINLSHKALGVILPYMRGEMGEIKRYDEAVAAAQESKNLPKIASKGRKSNALPPLKDYEPNLANPVVARALAEFRKVCNALLKKYGAVHKIHLEFTREVGKSRKERDDIAKAQRENFAANDKARQMCETLGLQGGGDLLKVKLWLEQGEVCAYSGEKITREHLLDATAVQIDHIYPYSRSFDDSYNNKVLVFSRENQNKLDKTPFEAFGSDSAKWGKILNLANSLPKPKKARITNQNFTDKEAGFLARNLIDTSYTARLVRDYAAECLEFLPISEGEDTTLALGEKGSKRHIEVISGQLSAMMRHYWGLGTILGDESGEKDRSNHLHHAIDAIIIAFMNPKIIKAFSDFKKLQEQNKAKFYAKQIAKSEFKAKRAFYEPCKDFRNKVAQKILGILGENGEFSGGIFVSKPPRKRARGAFHKETFMGFDDEKLLKVFGDKAGIKKAIDLGKRRQIGTKIVENGDMPRLDIFRHKANGKFYGVPIYTMDFANGTLPNKAVVVGKDKNGVIKDWQEMNEAYEFCFSLFKDDLILVQKKEMDEAELCYYVNFVTSNAQINVEKHDNYFATLTENQKLLFNSATEQEVVGKSIGIQGLKVFEKWQVSPLGECEFKASAEQPETRQEISLKSTHKKHKGRANSNLGVNSTKNSPKNSQNSTLSVNLGKNSQNSAQISSENSNESEPK